MNDRGRAASVLIEWARDGAFPDRTIEAMQDRNPFVTELVYGVCRQRRVLDWVIDRNAQRPPSPTARAFLWTGLYQLLFMDQTAEYAAVHETVDASKRLLKKPEVGFLNAMLRRVTRERDALLDALEKESAPLRLSHDDALFKRWERAYGEAAAIALCEWNNTRPDVVIRVTARTDMERYVASLDEAGIDTTPHPARPDAFLVLPRGIAVPDLPGYDEGHFAVQDPATAGAVALLDAQPGEAIWDACAAPGGKTAMIADAMQGEGTLVAGERHDDRVDRLEENLARLGHTGVEVRVADARRAKHAEFDAILLDVPCSNTGVLRRRPDARWRATGERIAAVTRLQRELLDGAAKALRPGGRIVYSTCSLEAEENEDLVATWLAKHPNFERVAETRSFPPHDHCDGAYAVCLRCSVSVFP